MNLIVAVDQNWAIGRGGDQLCYIPADLKRFKALTMGHAVIAGRKTLAAFPGGRPLPGRRCLLLSHQEELNVPGAEVFSDVEALLKAAPEDAFVVGGESVYRQLLPACDTAYVTKIDAAFPADRFFPNLDALPDWEIVSEETPPACDGLSFRYVTYRRKAEKPL